ncbi:hypothetical protein EG68_08359 [Paragonimus skrjabini miyazakii]|uniref:Uncharacterized protein n=1 Tax=Paragonimus skrjabini miyazakii TaxID=59628 RepID=A0A8S9YK40_9TREM|nr:hypothetical protein EG68_08359 [Paragonimus skrjabini miyazakii]
MVHTPFGLWFNLGIVYRQLPESPIIAYFNGKYMQVSEISKEPIRRGSIVEVDERWICLGAAHSNSSLTNVSMNDMVIWSRSLEEFESHRFLGYSRSQFNMLTSASHHWTPDFYISQNSLTQVVACLHPKAGKYLTPTVDCSETDVPGYALASFYKPHRSQSRCSSLDHMQKSPVPILKMRSDHYLLIGRGIDGTSVNLSNLWSEKCLRDPSTAYCRVHGFSLSVWIKLLSVSKDRSRFILPTGDAGTGVGEYSIGREISIFTEKLPLGASVSHMYVKWKLLLDFNSFEEGKWINIGLLWRQDVGLILLVNGVQSASTDEGGTTANTERLAQPFVVLDRLNDINHANSLTPYMADWENTH